MNQDWSNLNKNGWSFLNTDHIHYEWIVEAKEQLETKFHQKLYDYNDLRCGSTWFVGANFLDNSSNGNI